MGDIMADENIKKAPSYTLVGLFTGGINTITHNLTVDLFGRVDNLFDKEYVGSVIVNESNGRYYEPSPGRNYGSRHEYCGDLSNYLDARYLPGIYFNDCIAGIK